MQPTWIYAKASGQGKLAPWVGLWPYVDGSSLYKQSPWVGLPPTHMQELGLMPLHARAWHVQTDTKFGLREVLMVLFFLFFVVEGCILPHKYLDTQWTIQQYMDICF